MIDHMTFRVADIERAKSFYSAALAPLGYVAAYDAVHDGVRVLGFASNSKIDTWFVSAPESTTRCHLAWRAESRASVDAFHAAVVAAGGTDNGAPGPRPHYHPGYYGAFVIDPEGNNIEAVFHAPD
ncbi:VOC family protein [Niveibacterium umoris]|uniref:Catechol 2,3-dioxygenase-like lactoylglutathione lyase family enzyme n=1 Tax=Niveibacterium umoris TaxID=1193620 RepID=A0A840BDQ8_9RHOO|nr:VOC family protein [Niveibacterium umoris]MBB4010833.1 catechol 2,3-dioxygenase-like lactoylglutathione lyase family enzyme [Niveibacterium umoris]